MSVLKFRFLVIIASIFVSTCLKAQINKSVFIELGGNGFGVSLNYETKLTNRLDNPLRLRVGAGIFPLPDSTYYLIPALVTKQFNISKLNLEYGLGIVGFYNKKSAFGYDLTGTIGAIKQFKMHYYKINFTPFLTISDKKYDFFPFLGLSYGIKI